MLSVVSVVGLLTDEVSVVRVLKLTWVGQRNDETVSCFLLFMVTVAVLVVK